MKRISYTVGRNGINIKDEDGPVVAVISAMNLHLRSAPGASEVFG